MNARLIACANYYPMDSVYWWEWQLTSASEIMTIYKTRTELVPQIQEKIKSLHKYVVPCIIQLAEVSANQAYEDWIDSETRKSS